MGSGYCNTASGNCSTVAGGQNNTASGGYSNVAGGYSNSACGKYSNVSGGFNTASGYSSSVAGRSNTASACYSNVAGGYGNSACVKYSNVAGGYCNTASGYYSNVAGGYCNTASGNYSNVASGKNNTASGNYSSILGGGCNNTNSQCNTFILGSNITAFQPDYTYVNNLSSTNDLSVAGSLKNDEAEFINKLPVTSALALSGTLFIHNGGATGTSITCNSQQLFLVPIWVPTDCTIDQAGIYTSTNTSSVDVKICIYDAKFDGRPGKRIGTVATVASLTTGGVFSFSSFSSPITLKRGNYYAGIMGFTANVNLNRSVAGNQTMGTGMPIMSGIYRILTGNYDMQGGHLITSVAASTEPPVDLSSRTLDTTTGGGIGIQTTIRYRQSAPFVAFRLVI